MPNIKGEFGFRYGQAESTPNPGAICSLPGKCDCYNLAAFDTNTPGHIAFDASRGEVKTNGTYKNDIYGKSDHLQTNNITVRYWKRIA